MPTVSVLAVVTKMDSDDFSVEELIWFNRSRPTLTDTARQWPVEKINKNIPIIKPTTFDSDNDQEKLEKSKKGISKKKRK